MPAELPPSPRDDFAADFAIRADALPAHAAATRCADTRSAASASAIDATLIFDARRAHAMTPLALLMPDSAAADFDAPLMRCCSSCLLIRAAIDALPRATPLIPCRLPPLISLMPLSPRHAALLMMPPRHGMAAADTTPRCAAMLDDAPSRFLRRCFAASSRCYAAAIARMILIRWLSVAMRARAAAASACRRHALTCHIRRR